MINIIGVERLDVVGAVLEGVGGRAVSSSIRWNVRTF